MRILSCQFRNLNSLAGVSPRIDLEDGVLAEAGIFAITGPTGAGKTTILDAICVALYGMTPRLGSGSEISEIMTRHTGDCWSEVVFEVSGKRYRSRWDLRRAHGAADGRLQQAKMELVDLSGDEPKIVEEKKSLVPKVIEDITGLDADRFFRSIMLAQGHFAAFLEAKENERALLLEKMTGTEIYAEISATVYARAAAEKDSLDKLKIEQDAMDLMDDIQLHRLNEENDSLAAEEKKLADALAELSEKRQWLEAIAELETAIEQAEKTLSEVEAEEKLSQKEQIRLQRHRAAAPLTDHFARLEEAEKFVESTAKNLKAVEDEIPALENKLLESKDGVAAIREAVAAFRKTRRETEELIPKVVRLDQEIESKTESLKELEKETAEEAEKLKRAEDTLNEATSARDEIGKQLAQTADYLEAHKADECLERNFELLKSQLDARADLRRRIADCEAQIASMAKELENLDKQAEPQRKAIGEKSVALEKLEKELQTQKTELDKALAGKSVGDHEKALDALRDEQSRLSELLRQANARDELRKKNDELAEEQKGLDAEQKQLETGLSDLMKSCEQVERVIEELREKRKQELLIQKYEADRVELKDGQPCPLCGSAEHPWAEGVEQKLEADAGLKAQQKVLDKLEADAADKSKQLAAAETRLAGIDSEIATAQEKLAAIANEMSNADAKAEAVAAVVEETEEKLNHRRKQLHSIQALRDEIEARQEAFRNAEKELAELRRGLVSLEAEKRERDSEQKRNETARNEHAIQLSQLDSRLAELLDPLVLKIPDNDEDEFLALLSKRRDDFAEARSAQAELKQKAAQQNERIRVLTPQVKSLQKDLVTIQAKRDAGQSSIENLCKDRVDLFGEKGVDAVRTALARKESKFSETEENAQKEATLAAEELSARKRMLEHLRNEEKSAIEVAKTRCTAFEQLCREKGFKDVNVYSAALLDEKNVGELEQHFRDLQQKRTQAETRIEDAQKKLEAERKRKLTKDSLEALKQEEDQAKTTHGQVHDKRVIAAEQLKLQEERRKKQGEQLKAIEAQQKEADRWAKLSHLIGSATGDKFRRFAQGLTLDHLIGLANEHLSRFNDRYILKRGEDDELGIEIIDGYQADTIRPTSTLSGGESFLVSLALALGLSRLNSRKNHVDSLFLDEGFGTLDTDTLEVALAALHNIHTTGKTIGIISHVDALKERIPVQIQVRKLSGGISELEIVSI